jgi:hypothetical protein
MIVTNDSCLIHQSNILLTSLMTFNYSYYLSQNNSQSDCDENAECGTGLICFQRAALEKVPGCSGEANPDFDRKDVCVTKCTDAYCVLDKIGNDINPGTGHLELCEVSSRNLNR